MLPMCRSALLSSNVSAYNNKFHWNIRSICQTFHCAQIDANNVGALRALPPLHLRFPNIAAVAFDAYSVNNKLFASFVLKDAVQMKRLIALDLSSSERLGTAATALALAHLPGLREVSLPWGVQLPSFALAPLAQLPKLRRLSLSAACNDASQAALQHLTQLTALAWHVHPPSGAGSGVGTVITPPAGLAPVLRELRLSAPRTSSVDVSNLCGLTRLWLAGPVMCHADCAKQLSRLPRLRELRCGDVDFFKGVGRAGALRVAITPLRSVTRLEVLGRLSGVSILLQVSLVRIALFILVTLSINP